MSSKFATTTTKDHKGSGERGRRRGTGGHGFCLQVRQASLSRTVNKTLKRVPCSTKQVTYFLIEGSFAGIKKDQSKCYENKTTTTRSSQNVWRYCFKSLREREKCWSANFLSKWKTLKKTPMLSLSCSCCFSVLFLFYLFIPSICSQQNSLRYSKIEIPKAFPRVG